MKKLFAVSALVVSLGGGFVTAAQDSAKDDAKKAGQSAKDAGKNAGDAAKDAGKATGKATKKGAKKAKRVVTGDAHATCVDGTVQAGKTEAAAASGCQDHGGVAKK
jgi:hypothetical protein